MFSPSKTGDRCQSPDLFPDVMDDDDDEDDGNEVEGKDEAVPDSQHEFSDKSSQINSNPPLFLGISGSNVPADKMLVDAFLETFSNVTMVQRFDERMTHLVILDSEGRLCKGRSLSYVFAVANRCFVVQREWISQSIQAKYLQNCIDYEIIGDVEVDQNAMAVQRSRLAKVPLLSGHSFFLAKRFFVGADCITAAQLTQLIILVGGQAVRFWELEEDPEMNHVVFGQRSKRIGSARKLEKDMELPVIRAEWILDSIAQFRICERERYVISEESV